MAETLTAAQWAKRLAQRHAGVIALIEGERRRTYAELDRRSDQLAAALGAAGVGPGDRIAALLPNSCALIELYFAAAKLRAILLPVNFRLAAPEVAFILEDSAPRFLFVADTLEHLAESLDGAIRKIVVPTGQAAHDPYEAFLATGGGHASDACGTDPWIMLYTSGTTGRPKGCLLDQKGQIISALASAGVWKPRQEDRLLMALPLFHVGGLGILFAHMMAGATVILAPRTFSPQDAHEMLAREECTVCGIAPQLYPEILAVQKRSPRTLRLRHVSMGGGMHPVELLEEVRKVLGTEILLGYGQTEAGNFISYLTSEEQFRRPRSCGRILQHLDARIVDAGGRDLPPGEAGELLVRGPSVLSAYWQQPEQTAATLCDGWLRTGDIVSMDDEGFITLLSRVKELIKTGGENVYPKEVENVLLAHPAIAECAVFGIPHDHWGECVKAVIVPKPGQHLTVDEVVAWCRKHIAGYKRPRAIEFMDSLPRSDAGKLLMRELKARALTTTRFVD